MNKNAFYFNGANNAGGIIYLNYSIHLDIINNTFFAN